MDNNDNLNDSTAKSANRNSLNHVIDIIKAAFPYLDSDSQQSMELIITTGDFMEALHSFKQHKPVTTFSLRKETIDIEALLTNVRNACYEQEKEFIDMILNFIKAKNLYDTYTTFASAMASQTENTENSDGTSGGNGNPDMMEFLDTLLTPEQKSTFDNINMMFNTMQ